MFVAVSARNSGQFSDAETLPSPWSQILLVWLQGDILRLDFRVVRNHDEKESDRSDGTGVTAGWSW